MTSEFRVLGAGVWGLAFSDYLLNLGHNVEIFRRDTSLESIGIQQLGLKHIKSKHIKSLDTLNDQKSGNEINIVAVNSQGFSDLLNNYESYFSRVTELVSLTKGIDHQTGKFFSDLVFDKFINIRKYGLISGPSFAKDLCDGKRINVSFASIDDKLSKTMFEVTRSSYFQMTPTKYIYHIEIAGIIKNIAAIICGMTDEIFDKGIHVNKIIKKACDETWLLALELFEDLPGDEYKDIVDNLNRDREMIISSPGYIGDMILTCKQNQSRNYQFGKLIADKKISIEHAKKNIGTIEGYDCCKTLVEKYGARSELTNLLYQIINSQSEDRENIIRKIL
jgi:glycerol-3-phosphate dehydrogenase (NAD(P)+)|uniref:Glycerol-3-phosphate dehydrogenase n=1 Tax=uncultured bacterium BAC13K9BAC TaxID=332979 RepID=Q4JMY2_9BACT|nr:predicted GpsA [uncultured bacterium BAC13K9BAC]